jgi:soluble lytic murein transglycosylase
MLLSNGVNAFVISDVNSPHLQEQRQNYLKARTALKEKQFNRYRELRQKLDTYPLLPYLDYQEIYRDLNNFPYKKVDEFLETHENTYLGNLLLRQWLNQLAAKQHWHDYRSYFEENLKSTSHQCLFLWSRYKTGDKQALNEVETLWNVGKSQPDECDAIFAQWKKAGLLTNELLWSRYKKALLKKNFKFARYLKTQMPAATQEVAELFRKVLKKPDLLNNKTLFENYHPHKKDIIYHGLYRLLRNQPDLTWRLWQDYSATYAFSENERKRFQFSIAKRYAFLNRPKDVMRFYSALDMDQQGEVVKIQLREFLKLNDWKNISVWLQRLPETLKQEDIWQYWLARSMENLGRDKKEYQAIFENLSTKRSYYGFLSADRLGKPYSLQNAPTLVEQVTKQTLQNNPALQRARELFFIKKHQDARQEWKWAVANLSNQEYQGAAQMAYEWGWYRKSIESMAAAEAWNDLKIRFPIAHENIIRQQAKQTQLPSTLLFAIARQESAWEVDARSSAGAMGLMQLMPATAKETAKKAGIAHRKADLFEPEHNITLGSRYIGELLKKFNNNRLPAIAAYNAGPHRVNRWLAESANQLPYDVWIEVIPFRETRGYVKNVLAYAVVYSHRMGQDAPLLTQIEINKRL